MAKFGEILKDKKVLILFHNDVTREYVKNTSRAIAQNFETLKVIIIDTNLNIQLCEALRIIKLPTFLFYNDKELVHRFTGEPDLIFLIDKIKEQLKLSSNCR